MMYYTCSENKGADQLRGYCESDLRLCFRLCRLTVGFLMRRLLFYSALKVPQDTYECPLIIGTFRSIGHRVYSAAHVSSLTMLRSLSVVLLQTYTADFKKIFAKTIVTTVKHLNSAHA